MNIVESKYRIHYLADSTSCTSCLLPALSPTSSSVCLTMALLTAWQQTRLVSFQKANWMHSHSKEWEGGRMHKLLMLLTVVVLSRSKYLLAQKSSVVISNNFLVSYVLSSKFSFSQVLYRCVLKHTCKNVKKKNARNVRKMQEKNT